MSLTTTQFCPEPGCKDKNPDISSLTTQGSQDWHGGEACVQAITQEQCCVEFWTLDRITYGSKVNQVPFWTNRNPKIKAKVLNGGAERWRKNTAQWLQRQMKAEAK